MANKDNLYHEFLSLLSNTPISGSRYTLGQLQAKDNGTYFVKQALQKIYEKEGFSAEGAFPAFRFKITGNTLEVLILGKIQPLLKTPIILDVNHHVNLTYPILTIGESKVDKSSIEVVEIPSVYSGEENLKIEYSVTKLSCPIISSVLVPLKEDRVYLEYCLKNNVRVLSYEMANVLKNQIGLITPKMDVAKSLMGLELRANYSDLNLSWLYHQDQLSRNTKKAA